jgi:hypothetical protein
MSFDSMLGNVGIYVAVISALAVGVERIMDWAKAFFKKLVRKPSGRTEEEEEARRRAIRLIAVPVGILLAVVVQVDTFDILGLESPYWLGYPILGWALSGLAASRGSAFWHDIIDMVGEVKNIKKETAEAKRAGRN